MADQDNTASWYAVSGWNGPEPSMLRAESLADLDLARRVIAAEVGQFEHRLAALEKRLDPNSKAYEAVRKSKNRHAFDIVAEPVSAPDERSITLFAQEELVFEEPRAAEAVGMDGLTWLTMRFPGPGLMLQIGEDRDGLSANAAAKGFVVQKALSMEGDIQPSVSGFKDRYRAGPNSFATWLSVNASSARGSICFFSLGDGTQTKDVELMRWRLAPHQVVVTSKGSKTAAALLKRWDGKIYEMTDCMIFTDPGSYFLTPEHGGGSHLPDHLWPKISVVTVSFNQGQFLADCLDSVLDQNYPNLEYIVIDAVSTDGSVDILRTYEKRLSTLVIEKDRGQSDGLNKGFRHATGDILTWVNSDDMLAPGALKRAALTFMQYGCDLVTGGCERIREESSDVYALHHAALPHLEKLPLGFAENLVWHQSWEKGDYFFQPEVMFSADIWHRAGGFLKEHLYWAMDWELWVRMAMAGAEIVHVPDTIGRSRTHPDQKTTSEELYLYQLENILLEIGDAVSAVEKIAQELPKGEFRKWPINVALPTGPQRLSLTGRIGRLREPGQFKLAIRNRLSDWQVENIRRVRTALRRDGISGTLRRNLPRARRKRIREFAMEAVHEAQLLRARGAELEAENQALRTHVAAVTQTQHDYARAMAVLIEQNEQAIQVLRGELDAEKNAAITAAIEQSNAAMGEEYQRSLAAMKAEYEKSVDQTRQEIQQRQSEEVEGLRLEYEKSLKNVEAEYAKSVEQARADGQAQHDQEVEGLRVEYEKSLKNVESEYAGATDTARTELKAEHKREIEDLRKSYDDSLAQIHSEYALSRRPHRPPSASTDHTGLVGLAESMEPQKRTDLASVLAEFAASFLFETRPDDGMRETALELLDTSPRLLDFLKVFAEAYPDLHNRKTFRNIAPYLVTPMPFSLNKELGGRIEPMMLIDVGSEVLDFEEHLYAELIKDWPATIVSFDPFKDEDGDAEQTTNEEGKLRSIVLPNFVGDGKPATFHINHFRATSSLFATNEALVEPFGLVSRSMKTEDTKEVETSRLDQLAKGSDWYEGRVDLFKVDVQGGTLPVMKGAQQILKTTLVCHLEAEFASIYVDEQLFCEIDAYMQKKDFGLLDLSDLGRVPYHAGTTSTKYDFFSGRLLWADAVYVRHLNALDRLTDDELLRLSVLAHTVYQKYDLAAECLRLVDQRGKSSLLKRYLAR